MSAAAAAPAQEVALYVYALTLDDAPAPAHGHAILPGLPIAREIVRGVAALYSIVPRGAFAGDAALARDPAWVATCAAAHHSVLAGIAPAPCLPMRFGTLFADRRSLTAWLTAEAAAAAPALAKLQGRAEWSVTLMTDEAAQLGWLRANDAGLRTLAQQRESASPGAAFLIGKRIDRAEASARAGHTARIAAEIECALHEPGLEVLPDATGAQHKWSILAPVTHDMCASAAALGAGLRETGLDMRLTGPWPPYAFARAYWEAGSP